MGAGTELSTEQISTSKSIETVLLSEKKEKKKHTSQALQSRMFDESVRVVNIYSSN